MEPTGNRKRKKRRTRKCLDEIRKRSRLNNKLSNNVQREDFTKGKYNENAAVMSNINSVKIPCNSKITSKRLTLKPTFLSKTITSETITRPMISPVKSVKPQENNILIHDLCPSDLVTKSKQPDRSYVADCISNLPSLSGSLIEDNNENHTPQKGYSSCSPEHGVAIMNSDGNLDSTQSSAPTALCLSSTSSTGDAAYRLYAEFMEEIPIYLQQNAASLVKRNVMDKTKMLLQKIYMEGCHQDENILKSVSTGKTNKQKYTNLWSDSIVDDPMTYMRMSRREVDSDSHSISHSPESAQPPSSSSHASSPALTFIRDTPDYNYYPRKLNQ